MRAIFAGLAAVVAAAVASAASAQGAEYKSVEAGGWTVTAHKANGRFSSCTADRVAAAGRVRFIFMADLRRYIGIDGVNAPEGSRDQMTFTLHPARKALTFPARQFAGSELRIERPLTNDEFDSFDKAERMKVRIASQNSARDYDLGDLEAMTAAVDGCLTTYVDGGAPLPADPKVAAATTPCVYPCNPGEAHIVAMPGGGEQRYGSTRGWTIHAGAVEDRFAYCVGEKVDGDRKIRLGVDSGPQWQLAVPVSSNPDWSGSLDVDGDKRPISGAVNGRWTIAWLGMPELDKLRAGKAATLEIETSGGAPATRIAVPLDGVAAAILKIDECMKRKGRPPAERASAAPSTPTVDGDCIAGSQRCPAVARALPGGESIYIGGATTQDRPGFYVTFEARGFSVPGALYLTIDPIHDSGIKWGAGVPISFPGGEGGDAVDPGKPFKLPGPGTYVVEFASNTMADNAFGPFLVKMTVSSVARAAERPALCTLVVKGKTYIDGQCWFSPMSNGSFQIAGKEYFAQVNVDGKTAEAYWNADPKSTHAQARLGAVTRNGACWVNATTQVCARELPTDTLAAELAAQPKGDRIAAAVAGSICLMPRGMKWTQGVPLVVDNCPYGKSVDRFMRVGDQIRVDKAPDLCIGKAPGGPGLQLQTCSDVAVRWSYQKADVASAFVRSSDSDCWTIPELDNEKAQWPIAIEAQPCDDKRSKPQAFYF